MTPTAFTVVATVAAFGLLALCALFVIALARVARDGDEMAREHAAGKRAEKLVELEDLYASPPYEHGSVR
jgi:hypothetical protein